MTSPRPRYLALVPAAGIGARLGSMMPKQYLPMGERCILEWAVDAFISAGWIERIQIVVAPNDELAASMFAGQRRVDVVAVGGASRRDSVLNGLQRLAADPHDWVLVHDAARPGLSVDLLNVLRTAIGQDPVGGLLAVPAADTVKRAGEDGRVDQTLDRASLWLAQTPQMFRYGMLNDALANHVHATDEASAIEAAGHRPKLVMGSRENFKVTTAEDFVLMQRLMVGRLTSPMTQVHE